MKKILYLTYDGLLDPLGQSQILPYLRGLAKDAEWTILSYEKKWQQEVSFQELQEEFRVLNIYWIPLLYKKRFFRVLKMLDLVSGVIQVIRKNKRRNSFDCIHARSYVVALIAVILKLYY